MSYYWLKIGAKTWWPGEDVTEKLNDPKEEEKEIKEQVDKINKKGGFVKVIKFYEEEDLEIVKKAGSLQLYTPGEKNEEFIRKIWGIIGKSSSGDGNNKKKFESDLIKVESAVSGRSLELTRVWLDSVLDGNKKALSTGSIIAKRQSIVSGIFGTPAVTPPKVVLPGSIVRQSATATKNKIKAGNSTTSKKQFCCPHCSFSTERVGGIGIHLKLHSNLTPPPPKPNIPAVSKETDTKTRRASKKSPLKPPVATSPKRRRKNNADNKATVAATSGVTEKKEILMDWDDDEDEEKDKIVGGGGGTIVVGASVGDDEEEEDDTRPPPVLRLFQTEQVVDDRNQLVPILVSSRDKKLQPRTDKELGDAFQKLLERTKFDYGAVGGDGVEVLAGLKGKVEQVKGGEEPSTGVKDGVERVRDEEEALTEIKDGVEGVKNGEILSKMEEDKLDAVEQGVKDEAGASVSESEEEEPEEIPLLLEKVVKKPVEAVKEEEQKTQKEEEKKTQKQEKKKQKEEKKTQKEEKKTQKQEIKKQKEVEKKTQKEESAESIILQEEAEQMLEEIQQVMEGTDGTRIESRMKLQSLKEPEEMSPVKIPQPHLQQLLEGEVVLSGSSEVTVQEPHPTEEDILLMTVEEPSSIVTVMAKPTAAVRPTMVLSPEQEEQEPSSSSASLKVPVGVEQQQIMHLIPVENSDGTVTYMLVSLSPSSSSSCNNIVKVNTSSSQQDEDHSSSLSVLNPPQEIEDGDGGIFLEKHDADSEDAASIFNSIIKQDQPSQPTTDQPTQGQPQEVILVDQNYSWENLQALLLSQQQLKQDK